MKNKVALGAIIGFAAGAAAAITGKMAVDKVAGEIKSEMSEQSFTSPNSENLVTVSYGSSKSAKGLTFIRVRAYVESGEDECKLFMFSRKMPRVLDAQWEGNDHFKLLVGNGKRRQCCDVTFDEKNITAVYYLVKE